MQKRIMSGNAQFCSAAAEYVRAAGVYAGNKDYVLAAVREYCEAGDHASARMWLERLERDELPEDEQAEVELLSLEVESHTDPVGADAGWMRERLRRLARKYPGSDLVRHNLEALGA
ncbi:hypothetical protein [Allokutzneria oryzae]|uniref:Tetratricopeptide repeat protein n=1 Tax=Allokutzneria oryzae TaxID=1378989 RepID=A0ABV6A441_9PSEU